MDDPYLNRTIGSIRIEQLLGQGGMARVYLGRDINLHRFVAVKVIAEQYRENPVYQERFLREARAMASWQHPHIVQVHSAGIENGHPYFVMEYIHGKDLAMLMRQYTSQGFLLPYSEVARIGRAIASALDYAHQRGVIHRDVKPSNVLISDDGRVLLTDFGLAMNVTEGTQGEVFGSPQYMSPEQARSSATVVPQSDLYALGVMLYEMLVGRLPFLDPFPATLAMQHINAEVPAPRSLNPELSPAIESVLLKALRKSPADRYQSGAEMIGALENALPPLAEHGATEPWEAPRTSTMPYAPGGVVRPPSPPQPTTPPPPSLPPPAARRRMGWLPGCLIALLLALVGIGALVAYAMNRPNLPNFASQTQTAAAGLPVAENPTSTLTPELPISTAPPDATLTFTPEPSATPTITASPTATATFTATTTPPPVIEFEMWINDRNLWIVNTGDTPFQIGDLRLENQYGELSGEEFDDVDELESEDCVVLTRGGDRPQQPGNLKCETLGQPLEIDVSERFWSQQFSVFFRDEMIDRCRLREERCQFRYVPEN